MAKDAPVREIEPARVAGGLGGRVLHWSRRLVDDDKDIIAFAIVGLYADGSPFGVTEVDWPKEYPCNRHMFVGMAAELIRDNLITQDTACDIVNRANGFDD
jgi:hypothetical protein